MSMPYEAEQLPQVNQLAGKLSLEEKKSPTFVASLAATEAESRECQNLRYRVFAEEMGDILDATIPGVNEEVFDPCSKHLLVRDSRSGEIVGTTCLFINDGQNSDFHYYSETEFEMQNVANLPGRIMEVGKTCIQQDYRNSSAIAVLWQGLARIMVLHDIDHLIGCASISLDDGGANALAVINRLKEKCFSAHHLRVYPRKPLPQLTTNVIGIVRFPSLLKAYLRLGAMICGEAYWDVQFNVADVFVLLQRDQIDHRYARHFINNNI